jgi:lysophospholipase L1-like esterase
MVTKTGTTIYLFAGDSVTEGRLGESWVGLIAQALFRGAGGVSGQAINAGVAGETLASLLARIEEPLNEYRPDWVVLAIGANDVWYPWLGRRSLGWWLALLYRRLFRGQRPTADLDQFRGLYRQLIDHCQDSGAHVLLCTVGPLGENLALPPNRHLASLNGVIKQIGHDCGIPVADVWQAVVEELATSPKPSRYLAGEWLWQLLDRVRIRSNSPDALSRRRHLLITFDGLHPNSRGAALWARVVWSALAQEEGLAPERAAGVLNR